jgi:carbon monoxide dehydrogenase subunit G
MSFFFVDHHLSFTKSVAVPVQEVVRLLHDPPSLMQLSPLITSVSVDPGDATKYTIVDTLFVLGYRTTVTYNARITLHDDGMRAESNAGAGTRTVVHYTVRAISERVTEIEETVTVNVRHRLQNLRY